MGLAEKTCVPCRGGVPPLTAEQIRIELERAGFTPHPDYEMRELNRRPGGLRAGAAPVIYEGVFLARMV